MKKNKSATCEDLDLRDVDEFPDDWQKSPLLELCELIRGVSYSKGDESHTPKDGFTPLLRANNIDCELKFDDLYFVPERYVKPKQFLQQGDALFAMSSGSKSIVGKAATVNQSFHGTFGAFCGVLRPSSNRVDWKFFGYFFQTKYYRDRISKASAGVNINNLKREYFEAIIFPLPPLAEQQRIVARIETLLSQVNAARDRLCRVPLIMKKFRLAVLAAACEGRLTEGWRSKNPIVESAIDLLEKIFVKQEKKKIDYLKRMESLNDELNDLPENWIWTQMGFIVESMKNGIYKTPDFYKDDGFPCLRMYNIEDGKIVWRNIKHMALTDDEIQTYLLKQNDILINRVNSRELVGKSALITKRIEPCVYESKNIRLRMYDEEINSQYVVYWLQVNAQKYFNLNAQQTVGMASINQDQIASMPIPLPPLAEQHEIVRRVGLLFERADAVEREVAAATKRADALTQAVLAKAFAGKL